MERQDRYIVIKKSDLKAAISSGRLIGADQDTLNDILERLNTQRFCDNKESLKAVVVESDWPEYERVWKMIEARVNMENQHNVIKHNVNSISLSEGVLVFARLMVQAVIQDEHEEGYDLTAGLFGPHLSQLMVEVNKWRQKAELYDMLVNLMGYVQNGTDETIRLFQDDATMHYFVSGGSSPRGWGESARSLEQAIIQAHKRHGDKG